MRIRVALLVLACLLAFAFNLPAQEITGTLSGTVTDTNGSPVPNATVTLVREETTRQTATSESGVFFFNSISIGSYRINIEQPGFKSYTSTGIAVHVNDKIDLSISLTVGEISERVVVSGQTPLLQTESAELSTLVGEQQINELPLNGRDFNQLVDLVPGVAPATRRSRSAALSPTPTFTWSTASTTWIAAAMATCWLPLQWIPLKSSRFCATTTAPNSAAPPAA